MTRAALLVLALAACQPRSELLVGFATDLTAPDMLDEIELNVVDTDGTMQPGDGVPYDLTGVEGMVYNLPGSYAFFSEYGDVTLTLTLTGTHAGAMVATQTVTLGVVAGQTLFYRMGITGDCVGVTCGSGTTCVEGTCLDAAVEDAKLPPYTPELVTTLTCIEHPATPERYLDTANGSAMPLGSDAMNCDPSLCRQGLCLLPPDPGSGGGGSGSDPFTSSKQINAPDASGSAGFGFAVAMSADGTTAVIGADTDGALGLNAGAAYVYVRAGSDWNEQAILRASNGQMNDRFGTSVAISGDGTLIAVGAESESSGTASDPTDNSAAGAGAVYIFQRDGATMTWTQQQYVKADVIVPGTLFGNAVALSSDGRTLAVGEALDSSGSGGIDGDETNANAVHSGAVFIYTSDGQTFTKQAYLKAAVAKAGVELGTSLALSADGGHLVAGAPGDNSGSAMIDGDQTDTSATAAGAAYVFVGSGASWTQQAYLKASDTAAGDVLGNAVAIDGSGATVVAGAPYKAIDGGATTGVAYVFGDGGGTWTQQTALTSPVPVRSADFGTAVAMSSDGSQIAVGEIQDNGSGSDVNGSHDPSLPLSGAVYQFPFAGGSAAAPAYVKATMPQVSAELGYSVSLSTAGALIVGAPFTTISAPACGAAYLYY